ncbi:MAG: hypothetical protein QM749_17670 [Aquabacterium sp.]
MGITTTSTLSYTVQTCERYDYAYWSDTIALWFGALVIICAAKVLYIRVFSRETL